MLIKILPIIVSYDLIDKSIWYVNKPESEWLSQYEDGGLYRLISEYLDIDYNWLNVKLITVKAIDNILYIIYATLIPKTSPLLKGQWKNIDDITDTIYKQFVLQGLRQL